MTKEALSIAIRLIFVAATAINGSSCGSKEEGPETSESGGSPGNDGSSNEAGAPTNGATSAGGVAGAVGVTAGGGGGGGVSSGATGSSSTSGATATNSAGSAPTAGAAGSAPAGIGGTPEPIQLVGNPVESHPDIPLETVRDLDCLECHANPAQYPDTLQLIMGGSVFTRTGEPAAGVVVSAVTDAVHLLATTGANGLFQIPSDPSIDFDWESAVVTMRAGDTVVEKDSEATGACNRCHVDALRLEVP